MADILVKYGNKRRMWNTVVDAWVSPLMTEEETVWFLLLDEYADTPEEAVERVFRIGYDRKHLGWLKKYFDSQYHSLSRTHRVLHRICPLQTGSRK